MIQFESKGMFKRSVVTYECLFDCRYPLTKILTQNSALYTREREEEENNSFADEKTGHPIENYIWMSGICRRKRQMYRMIL